MMNSHLEKFFRLSSELFCIIDSDGFFTMVNPAFSKLLGFTQEELSEKHYTSFIHPDDLEATSRKARKLLHGIPVKQYENRYFTKEGRTVWLSWTSSIIENGFLYAVAKDVTRLKEAEWSLRTKEKEIAVSMFRAQEKERTRLGQELHDNINQLLTSARLYVEFMQTNEEKREELLRKSHQLLGAAIEEIRMLSHQLVIPDPESPDLARSIEELAKDLLAPAQVQYQLHLICFRQYPVCHEFRIVLYRIIQEQFSNIVKHAGASLVTLRIEKDEEILKLEIEDNGKGFKPSCVKRGIGLSNIFNRASLFGGQAEIDSAPAEGCRLTVKFEGKERIPI